MNMDPVKAKREAEIRDKLPDDVVALVDAANLRPGELHSSRTRWRCSRKLRADNPAAWRCAGAVQGDPDVPIGDLDRMTAPVGGEGDGKQGREMEWPDPDPCPDPVDGAPMLSDIAAFIRRHVWIDEPEADALALWAVMTWIHDRLEISTFANLTSATKRCGKSLLLELLAELVYRPQPLSGQVTGAVLFRMVEVHAPTLMLDEADTYIRDDEAVRGIVNGSQRRALAYIPRCVEPDYQPRLFGTWCPKLIAGIGGIPDTIRDRSLVVRLERKPASERVSPWRERDREAVNAMRGQIARWTGDNAGRIVAARSAVAFPDVLHDRARDAWESLLAIANAAGGEWAGTRRARVASLRALRRGRGRRRRRRPRNAARRPVRHLRCGRMAGSYPERNHRRTAPGHGGAPVVGMEAREADHRPPVSEPASSVRRASAQPSRPGRAVESVLSRRAPSRVRCLSPQQGGIRSVPPSQCLETRGFREFASVPARNRGTERKSRKPLQ